MLLNRIGFLRSIFLLCLALLTGCQARPAQPLATPSSVASVTPLLPTRTSPPPTPSATPVPLALIVNGEGLPLAEFEAELNRLQQAEKELNKASSLADQRRKVAEELINELLLAQAAANNGYQVTESQLESHIEKLQQQLGSNRLSQWQQKYGYTEESFRVALRRSIAAAWQRDQIANSVPQTAEQVHARQILVLTADLANKIYQQLQAGADFATLAKQYDPLTGGDLGWFPRRYLTQPDVEKAAFQLSPGQYSAIIQTDFGYHIIQVIERDSSHPLSLDAQRVLQHLAIQDWLEEQRKQANIQILLADWNP